MTPIKSTRLTPLEQCGRQTNLEYLPTKTLEVRHQGVEIDERMKKSDNRRFTNPPKRRDITE